MRRSVMGVGALLLLLAAGAEAQTCDPDFGDQIYRWVDKEVPSQSRRLAKADFAGRTFNGILVGSQVLNARVVRVGEGMDQLARHIARHEAASTANASADALRRDESATRMLNELYSLRAELDEIERQSAALLDPPSRAEFMGMGLQNVGRATLLASMQELGNAREASLAGRYSVYVSTSFDENGRMQDLDVQQRPSDATDAMVSSVVGAAHAQGLISGPWAAAIVFAYSSYRLAEDAKCRERVKQQEKRYIQAIGLLPSRLITPDEQFELYQASHANAKRRFGDFVPAMEALIATQQKRWRELFALNAARQQAADAVLNAARVDSLRRQYEEGGPLGRLFHRVALINTATDIGRINSYLAEHHGRLLGACGNLDGFIGVEDQVDAADYALASFETFQARPEFAPLHTLLAQSAATAASIRAEASTIRRRFADSDCSEPGNSAAVDALQRNARLAAAWTGSAAEGRMVAQRARASGVRVYAAAELVAPAPQQMGFCILYRRGAVYTCAPGSGSGSGGAPYSDQFTNGGADPLGDIFGGAADGGYATDNRQVSARIADLSRNVEARIEDVQARAAEASDALPEWIEQNRAALAARGSLDEAGASSARDERSAFSSAHHAEVAAARAQIESFAREPFDPRRMNELVSAVGATVLQLPALRSDAVVPGMPALSGTTAERRVYGEMTDRLRMEIHRERLKAEGLAPGHAAVAADDALDLAEQFSTRNPRLAEDLLADARALRYWARGERRQLDVAVIDEDGSVTRRAVENAEVLPPDALISRAKRMTYGMVAFRQQSASTGEMLRQMGASADRLRAVSTSDEIAAAGESAFFSGDLLDGEHLLDLAKGVLDLATSLAPGVSWGRDIYEAFTGRDLFTDEPMDAVLRTTAVIGAITGGIADKPLDVLRAIEKLKPLMDVADAERVVNAARHADSGLAKEGYILVRMEQRLIDEVDVDIALDSGSRWWDAVEQSVIMVGPDKFDFIDVGGDIQRRVARIGEVPHGQARVVVALDPKNEKLVTTYLEPRSDKWFTEHVERGRRRFHRLEVEP